MNTACNVFDNHVLNGACQSTIKWLGSGLDYTAKATVDGLSLAQEKCLRYGSLLAKATDDRISSYLLGRKDDEFKTDWRFHRSFTAVLLTTLCGAKTMKNLGLSWKYLPIPLLRSKKIVSIMSVRLPGDDVSVDKVREDERALDKSVKNFVSAALWGAGTAFGLVGVISQIYHARAEQSAEFTP